MKSLKSVLDLMAQAKIEYLDKAMRDLDRAYDILMAEMPYTEGHIRGMDELIQLVESARNNIADHKRSMKKDLGPKKKTDIEADYAQQDVSVTDSPTQNWL